MREQWHCACLTELLICRGLCGDSFVLALYSLLHTHPSFADSVLATGESSSSPSATERLSPQHPLQALWSPSWRAACRACTH